jgi:hypothetical protein
VPALFLGFCAALHGREILSIATAFFSCSCFASLSAASVLDGRSRLACHLQWYLAETAEIIAH